MPEGLWKAITPELIAGAIVGIGMLGLVARNAILGWYEAMKKVRESEKSMTPMATALSISWDRDQIERTLQALESIAASSAIVAAAQTILSDKERADAKNSMQEILDRLDAAESKRKDSIELETSRRRTRKRP